MTSAVPGARSQPPTGMSAADHPSAVLSRRPDQGSGSVVAGNETAGPQRLPSDPDPKGCDPVTPSRGNPRSPSPAPPATAVGPRAVRRVSYGLDAPPVVAGFLAAGLLGTACLILTAVTQARLLSLGVALFVVGWATAALMIHSSVRGKRLVRDRVLDALALSGDEDLVDLGTGRGLMLLGAVRRTPRGSGTGIDLWRSIDQAGSRPERLLANATALGVAERVRVLTGDFSSRLLPAASADVVLACLALHNVHDREKRRATLLEAARILRPGGQLAIVDFAKTSEYVIDAWAAGLVDVTRSALTPLMWPPVRVVTARKIEPNPGG
jgi:arsenite methyltransferase